MSIATGWATIALMVGGRFVFQYLGWGFAAAATPAVMLLTGGAFFGLSIAARLSPGAVQLAAAGVTAGAITQARWLQPFRVTASGCCCIALFCAQQSSPSERACSYCESARHGGQWTWHCAMKESMKSKGFWARGQPGR